MDREYQPSDGELVQRFQAGDRDALETLFQRHLATLRARIERWLSAPIRRKVSVSDVLQEARLVALRRLLDFQPRSDDAVRAWLARIAELKAREVVKRYAVAGKRASGREVTRDARPATAQFLARDPSPSQAAITAEDLALARRALEALPADHRDVLRLVREEGLTLREAGERMGRSREAAKKLYGRAAARFTLVVERLREESHG